jgi:hypothetical protein
MASDRFRHVNGVDESMELVARFEEALFDEHCADTTDFIEKSIADVKSKKPAGPALNALLKQLTVMLHFHEKEMREMMEDPIFCEVWERFVTWMDSLFGEGETE